MHVCMTYVTYVCMYMSVYACMYVNTHSFYKAEIKPEVVKCQSITDKLEAEKEKSGRPGGYPPSQSKIFVFFFLFFSGPGLFFDIKIYATGLWKPEEMDGEEE